MKSKWGGLIFWLSFVIWIAGMVIVTMLPARFSTLLLITILVIMVLGWLYYKNRVEK